MPQYAEQPTVDTYAVPVPAQPTGLDVFDLKVTATPLVINWDADALNAALDAVLAQYRDIDVTADNIPAIKTEMAGLNKLRDRLDTARKDIARHIKQPVDEFESGVKGMLARITEVRGVLDAQVKTLEEQDRNSRRAAVQLMIDAAKDKAGLPDLDIPINDRWLNKTARTSATQAEIENLIFKARQEQEAAAQRECAQADRATLVGETIKNVAANYGFELPMGRFAACLSLDMPADAAMARIREAFAAEALSRVPTAVPQEEVDADVFAMSTATEDPGTPPHDACSLTVRLTYDEEQERDVLHLLDQLRNVAQVDIL